MNEPAARELDERIVWSDAFEEVGRWPGVHSAEELAGLAAALLDDLRTNLRAARLQGDPGLREASEPDLAALRDVIAERDHELGRCPVVLADCSSYHVEAATEEATALLPAFRAALAASSEGPGLDVERLMSALEVGHKRQTGSDWADRAGLRRYATQIAAEYGRLASEPAEEARETR